MLKIALIPLLAAMGGVFVLPAPSFAGEERLASPTLGRHVSTKVRFRGLGPDDPIAGGVYVAIPGLAATIKCPGPGGCYVVIDVKVQFANTGGASGVTICPSIDGNSVSPCGNLGNLQNDYYQMFANSVVAKVSKGKHNITVLVQAGAATSYAQYFGQYSVYKP